MKIVLITAAWLLISCYPAFCSGYPKSLPDVTVSNSIILVVPGDPGQGCAVITNRAGGHPMNCGDANCSASQCAEVESPGSVTFCTTAAIYCYSTSGATAAITKIMN